MKGYTVTRPKKRRKVYLLLLQQLGFGIVLLPSSSALLPVVVGRRAVSNGGTSGREESTGIFSRLTTPDQDSMDVHHVDIFGLTPLPPSQPPSLPASYDEISNL